jgi:hypothetical protein
MGFVYFLYYRNSRKKDVTKYLKMCSSYNRGNTELWLVKLESDQIEQDEVSTQPGAIYEKSIPGFGFWAAVVSVVIVLFQEENTML